MNVSTKKLVSWIRRALIHLLALLAIVFAFVSITRAGGPKYIAGSTYFNSSTTGLPITWSLGQVRYYTDQGDLSPILPNAAANAFIASAFSQWTSVTSAFITATNAGQLAEDVNGSNVAVDSSGFVTAPADITPAATTTPVGIVYDYDGSVTDALLGSGAGDVSQCFWNAVFGGPDNFGVGANLLHALVVINGQCALQSTQLTDVEYRLVRVLGTVLGLGWSQLNLNVITGNPPATPDDYSGFPVMHDMDPDNCIPITLCFKNPYQLAPDDVAALSRLYPAAGTSTGSARIHGSVYFMNHFGAEGQPMQGVNVFARWIDPSTNLPSHRYSASSVSGFLFTGNAGNAITGFTNPLGVPYSEFGSPDQALEGFFDLGGLPIPNAGSTAQYQLSVEALNPLWSPTVGPYSDYQVAPSGTFAPITVTVNAGGDIEQDILLSGSGQAVPPWAASETWISPAPVPSSGDWVGSLSGYGNESYFLVTAQANRTLSIAVTALDETGVPTESKAAPVVGVWTLGDPQGTIPPAFTSSPFNSETFATSRLDAQVLSSNSFIVGLADLRGDGRPDYSYHAHILYGDSISPTRVPVSGGAITLQGTGFAPGLTLTIGSANVPLVATDAGQILVTAPAQSDGLQTITITDPVTGAFSTMTNVLTYGAASTDQLLLLQGANTSTPIGTQATKPVSVRVVAADGVTSVIGATVGWTTTNGATLSACGGGSSCSVQTDQGGMASTAVTPTIAGTANITATLAPGVYNPSQSVSGVLSATSSPSEIGITTPYFYVVNGTTVSVPITARALNNGVPQSGVTVSFRIAQGTGSLSAPTAVTGSTGYASVTLTLTDFIANVQLSVCIAPSNNPCATVYGNGVAAALLNLQPVAGAGQVITGSAFQPLTVRVTDTATPPDPVLGASVVFQSTVMRPLATDFILAPGAPPPTQLEMPIILSSSQTSVTSDANGLASFVPSVGPFTGTLEVAIQVSAVGASATLSDLLESLPQTAPVNVSQPVTKTPPTLWYENFPDFSNSDVSDDPNKAADPD
jgi:hypothetical protein